MSINEIIIIVSTFFSVILAFAFVYMSRKKMKELNESRRKIEEEINYLQYELDLMLSPEWVRKTSIYFGGAFRDSLNNIGDDFSTNEPLQAIDMNITEEIFTLLGPQKVGGYDG